jgi:hypothetical protein
MKPRVNTSMRIALAAVIFALTATPAPAYWQFIQRPPGAEVKPSPRYASQKQCEEVLKKVEAALKGVPGSLSVSQLRRIPLRFHPPHLIRLYYWKPADCCM